MQDLDDAIAECQGQPHPTPSTCIKLAAFLTIKQSMAQPTDHVSPAIMRAASTERRTEFEQAIDGMPMDEIISLFSELMNTIQTINPKLYAAVMRRIV
jgi:hypothetical protein